MAGNNTDKNICWTLNLQEKITTAFSFASTMFGFMYNPLETKKPKEVILKTVNIGSKPTRFSSIGFDQKVEGVAVLGKEIFVILASSPEIKIFRSDTLAYRSSIPVNGLQYPSDITASSNALYISESIHGKVHGIEMPGRKLSTWSTGHGRTDQKLSLTREGNLLVICYNPSKLYTPSEYTPSGKLLREIVPQNDILYLHYAIQVSGDQFIVCHGWWKTLHRVCLIDNTGHVIKSYGGEEGTQIGNLKYPYHLAVGSNGLILVADYGNNRVLLLNSDLEFVEEFISESLAVTKPFRLCLDEAEQCKFYVSNADASDNKILIFNII